MQLVFWDRERLSDPAHSTVDDVKMGAIQVEDAETAPSWDQWLAASVAGLQERSLFRTLRPTVPGLSAVEVGVQTATQPGAKSGGSRQGGVPVRCL